MSSIMVIIDPFLEVLCYPVEICFKDKFCFARSKLLKKADDKFQNELEVSNILGQLRTTNQMMKNLQTKDQKSFIKYNCDYVIDNLVSQTESEDESSEHENLDNPVIDEIKKAFRYSVIKGMSVENELKQKINEIRTKQSDDHKEAKLKKIKKKFL